MVILDVVFETNSLSLHLHERQACVFVMEAHKGHSLFPNNLGSHQKYFCRFAGVDLDILLFVFYQLLDLVFLSLLLDELVEDLLDVLG